MKIQCFTSFTFSYLNRARVLFTSLRKYHPEWELVALITDEPPPSYAFRVEREPFDKLVYATDLGIKNFDSWIFRHTVVEVCTAVKGPYMRLACDSGADAVVYLDPDTCLFGSLDPLLSILQTSDIVLTPHTITPETARDAIIENEIGPLQHGAYNLGFCAIKTSGEGARFANWWSDRLLNYCYEDLKRGLFVDQKWCDMVPAFFDNVKILRDPGYNVASWNLSNREVAIHEDGSITVNGSPLRFWHFTKAGSTADVMTRRYAQANYTVYELWNWYNRSLAEATEPAIPSHYWAYSSYDDGTPIQPHHRIRYREHETLQDLFREPFATDSASYYRWLIDEGYFDEDLSQAT